MSVAEDMLPDSARFGPAGDAEAFLASVPAKWVVYLMTDEADRPVQLLCVKNLRYSLKRRLVEVDDSAPSRRVDYRQLVRHVHWRRVDSAFEADVLYLEAARQFFPQSYRGMAGLQPAWFLHVNPDASFPRYIKTTDLSIVSGQLLGPIEDKQTANRLIDDVADWFDLCRYYNILVQSPNGAACAYKEMGKCPAPCDGTISMEHYRMLIDWSARALVEPRELIQQIESRMKAAATELRFESAAKIKAYLESISQLGKGPLRHLRKLRDFRFLSIQRGPRDGTAKAFVILPDSIEEVAGQIDRTRVADVMRLALERAECSAVDSIDAIAAERIGLVSFHLFQPKGSQGVFIPLDQIDERAIRQAIKDVQKQSKDDTPEESEGVIKELQSL